MHGFAKFIDNCHILELEYFDLPFTWFNKRSDSSYFLFFFEKLYIQSL